MADNTIGEAAERLAISEYELRLHITGGRLGVYFAPGLDLVLLPCPPADTTTPRRRAIEDADPTRVTCRNPHCQRLVWIGDQQTQLLAQVGPDVGIVLCYLCALTITHTELEALTQPASPAAQQPPLTFAEAWRLARRIIPETRQLAAELLHRNRNGN